MNLIYEIRNKKKGSAAWTKSEGSCVVNHKGSRFCLILLSDTEFGLLSVNAATSLISRKSKKRGRGLLTNPPTPPSASFHCLPEQDRGEQRRCSWRWRRGCCTGRPLRQCPWHGSSYAAATFHQGFKSGLILTGSGSMISLDRIRSCVIIFKLLLTDKVQTLRWMDRHQPVFDCKKQRM